MKTKVVKFALLILIFACSIITLKAQEARTNSLFSPGVDFYSNYVWRGTRLGIGPAVQPSFVLSSGGFTLGVWGSIDFYGYSEADPYISYTFPFGLSLGLTDYYFPDLSFFETSPEEGSHAFEINAGYSVGGFSLSANYIINEAGGAASAGGDLYFQAGYAFPNLEFFIGAGDGWHTSDGEFSVCNIGLGTGKDIKLSESFSLPVTGQVILNPEREQLFLVVGLSL